jgi:hypothetical protein
VFRCTCAPPSHWQIRNRAPPRSIRFVRFSADELVVNAEIDPPGGWRCVALKLSTGQPGAA